MKTYSGKFFIVPNLARLVVYEAGQGNGKTFPTLTAGSGFNIAVEVWFHSDECDNWSCHGGPLQARCLPLEKLALLQEGDSISFESFDRKGEKAEFRLTAAQKEFRYKSHGDFAEVLRKVTSEPNYCYSLGEYRKYMNAIYADLVGKAFKSV